MSRHTGQEDQFNLKKIDHDFWVNFLISGIILIATIAINNFWDNGPWRKWVFLIWPICHIYAPFNIVWKSVLYVSFQFWMISNHCYDLKNELSTMQYPHLVTLNMILYKIWLNRPLEIQTFMLKFAIFAVIYGPWVLCSPKIGKILCFHIACNINKHHLTVKTTFGTLLGISDTTILLQIGDFCFSMSFNTL